MTVVTCGAPYGRGGLGQHLAQVVEELRGAGRLGRYYAYAIREGDGAVGRVVPARLAHLLNSYTPARFSPGWRSHLGGELFDRHVAGALNEPVDECVAFVGKALHTFRRARAHGARRLVLMAANSHVNNLKRQHDRAVLAHGIERGWLNEAQRRKTLREYEAADVITVASEYTRRSFLAEGVPEAKLERMHLRVDPRFRPADERPSDGVFRVVSTGRITIDKGAPVLLEAFARLRAPEAELTFVGSWSTRPMRRYLQAWMARDPRVRVAPGDPLPYLQRADVYVHPAYEDGFSYAPMEALACGAPVVVTEDTGMKEHVREGVNGYVVPTGDPEALLERLEHLLRTKS